MVDKNYIAALNTDAPFPVRDGCVNKSSQLIESRVRTPAQTQFKTLTPFSTHTQSSEGSLSTSTAHSGNGSLNGKHMNPPEGAQTPLPCSTSNEVIS